MTRDASSLEIAYLTFVVYDTRIETNDNETFVGICFDQKVSLGVHGQTTSRQVLVQSLGFESLGCAWSTAAVLQVVAQLIFQDMGQSTDHMNDLLGSCCDKLIAPSLSVDKFARNVCFGMRSGSHLVGNEDKSYIVGSSHKFKLLLELFHGSLNSLCGLIFGLLVTTAATSSIYGKGSFFHHQIGQP